MPHFQVPKVWHMPHFHPPKWEVRCGICHLLGTKTCAKMWHMPHPQSVAYATQTRTWSVGASYNCCSVVWCAGIIPVCPFSLLIANVPLCHVPCPRAADTHIPPFMGGARLVMDDELTCGGSMMFRRAWEGCMGWMHLHCTNNPLHCITMLIDLPPPLPCPLQTQSVGG